MDPKKCTDLPIIIVGAAFKILWGLHFCGVHADPAYLYEG